MVEKSLKIVIGVGTIGAQQALYSHLIPSPSRIREISQDEIELENIKRDAVAAFVVSEAIALGAALVTRDRNLAAVGTISNVVLFLLFAQRAFKPKEPQDFF